MLVSSSSERKKKLKGFIALVQIVQCFDKVGLVNFSHPKVSAQKIFYGTAYFVRKKLGLKYCDQNNFGPKSSY